MVKLPKVTLENRLPLTISRKQKSFFWISCFQQTRSFIDLRAATEHGKWMHRGLHWSMPWRTVAAIREASQSVFHDGIDAGGNRDKTSDIVISAILLTTDSCSKLRISILGLVWWWIMPLVEVELTESAGVVARFIAADTWCDHYQSSWAYAHCSRLHFKHFRALNLRWSLDMVIRKCLLLRSFESFVYLASSTQGKIYASEICWCLSLPGL